MGFIQLEYYPELITALEFENLTLSFFTLKTQ